MSQEEVVQLLHQAVVDRRRITAADLRAELQQLSHKFSKINNPLTRYPGFIATLIQMGEESNAFQVERGKTAGNPTLSLPNAEEEVQESANAADNDLETQGATQETNDAAPAMAHPVKAVAISHLGEAERASRRVSVFEGILRSNFLGPFSRIRKFVFDDLKACADEKVYTPTALIAAAIEKCKKRDLSALKRPPAWGIIQKFLYSTLLRVPVLQGQHGKLIGPNLTNVGTTVVGVDDNFDKKIEKEMLLVLIKEAGNVSGLDIPDLAHLLFPDQSDGVAIVESLLVDLQRSKKIHEVEKVFRLRPQPQRRSRSAAIP